MFHSYKTKFTTIVHYHEFINSPSQHGKVSPEAGSPSVAPGYGNRGNRDEADDNVNCMTPKKNIVFKQVELEAS